MKFAAFWLYQCLIPYVYTKEISSICRNIVLLSKLVSSIFLFVYLMVEYTWTTNIQHLKAFVKSMSFFVQLKAVRFVF